MKKKIAVLGSTGSIGVNTMRVVAALRDDFEVVALSAETNITLLSEQITEFKARVACTGTAELAGKLKRISSGRVKCVFGRDGLKEIVSRRDIDIVLFAISGLACLAPLIEAIMRKKRIALANKESLVSAGSIIMRLARRNGVTIIPVDSEHNAVFQCLEGTPKGSPMKIYLTGSGGPLLNVDKKKFDKLPRSFILNHPKWRMGRKISVDSATMMNKGLEIIEAKHLFSIDEKRIEVLIHPEAIVHSMVEFADSSVLAQLAVPDMRIPIQYALAYPDPARESFGSVIFPKIGNLSFRKPDTDKFPCLGLAREAALEGGTAGAVLCASDEEAVKNYLDGEIKFSDIPKVIEKVLSRHHNIDDFRYTVSDVLEEEEWAKEEARSICSH